MSTLYQGTVGLRRKSVHEALVVVLYLLLIVVGFAL